MLPGAVLWVLFVVQWVVACFDTFYNSCEQHAFVANCHTPRTAELLECYEIMAECCESLECLGYLELFGLLGYYTLRHDVMRTNELGDASAAQQSP